MSNRLLSTASAIADWDFEKDGIVELKGEWRFVWEEFVEPMRWVFNSPHCGIGSFC